MKDFLGTFLIELIVLSILGLIYYFYQRRKILHFEANKTPIIMGMILESCLSEKTEEIQPELDEVISALDDFLQNQTTPPPVELLRKFMHSKASSPELTHVIQEGLSELYGEHGKE